MSVKSFTKNYQKCLSSYIYQGNSDENKLNNQQGDDLLSWIDDHQ